MAMPMAERIVRHQGRVRALEADLAAATDPERRARLAVAIKKQSECIAALRQLAARRP